MSLLRFRNKYGFCNNPEFGNNQELLFTVYVIEFTQQKAPSEYEKTVLDGVYDEIHFSALNFKQYVKLTDYKC